MHINIPEFYESSLRMILCYDINIKFCIKCCKEISFVMKLLKLYERAFSIVILQALRVIYLCRLRYDHNLEKRR